MDFIIQKFISLIRTNKSNRHWYPSCIQKVEYNIELIYYCLKYVFKEPRALITGGMMH